MLVVHIVFIITAVLPGLTAGQCRLGWLHYGESCYYFSSIAKDWVTASATCRSHKAELAIITSQAENRFIEAEVKQRTGDFWLDGTDEFTEGRWEWASTGESFHYSNWFPGEPNGHTSESCLNTGSKYGNGGWNDRPCNYATKFICEKSIQESVIG